MGIGIRLNKDGKPTWGSRLKYWFGSNQEYKDFYKSMYENSSTESSSLFSRFKMSLPSFPSFFSREPSEPLMINNELLNGTGLGVITQQEMKNPVSRNGLQFYEKSAIKKWGRRRRCAVTGKFTDPYNRVLTTITEYKPFSKWKADEAAKLDDGSVLGPSSFFAGNSQGGSDNQNASENSYNTFVNN